MSFTSIDTLRDWRIEERRLVRFLVSQLRAPAWQKGGFGDAEAADASMRLMIGAHRRHHTLLVKLEQRI